jgi:hypothetical protein
MIKSESGRADTMADVATPMELSADAALELEELDQGKRVDAPALDALFQFLRTPVSAVTFAGHGGLSMLADIRAYTILRDSIGRSPPRVGRRSEFEKLIAEYLIELEAGVHEKKSVKIQEAKRFCLSLSENLLSKRMADVYHRRERVDSRYISYDDI